MTDDGIDTLSCDQTCSMLNLSPVIVAKHFQYRVEGFYRHVLPSSSSSVKPTGEFFIML